MFRRGTSLDAGSGQRTTRPRKGRYFGSSLSSDPLRNLLVGEFERLLNVLVRAEQVTPPLGQASSNKAQKVSLVVAPVR